MPPTPTKLAREGGAIRLTLSAKVANDLGALQGSLKSLAERLGHPNCATGCDTLFLQSEREFVLDAELNLSAAPLSQPLTPALGRMVPQGTIQVMIPARVNNNIKNLQRALELTLGKLGCPRCCSGFDILFQREISMFAFDDKVGLRGFGQFR